MTQFDFGNYAGESGRFWEEMAGALHVEERHAGSAVRVVFHTLRDIFTVQESIEFMQELPVFLKALYVEDWAPLPMPDEINDHDGLLERVRHYLLVGENSTCFGEKEQHERMIYSVLEVLSRYTDIGEFVPGEGALAGTAQLPQALTA